MENFRTEHFTLAELVKSDVAAAKRIDNTPTPEIEQNLKRLMICALEPARQLLGEPIFVTSGYRCEKLNKAVGGVPTSQHVKGQAADLRCKTVAQLKNLFQILSGMDIDQLLYEKNSKGSEWIHVSFVEHGQNRHMVRDNYVVK